MRTTFQSKLPRVFSKNRHPHRAFFTTKVRNLFPLKEVKPSPDRSQMAFALKLVVKWHSHCPVKMTSVRARASLVSIGKISSSSQNLKLSDGKNHKRE